MGSGEPHPDELDRSLRRPPSGTSKQRRKQPRPVSSGGASGLELRGEWGGGESRERRKISLFSQANLSCLGEDEDKEACH